MSCGTREGFNLEYGSYPGTDFPSECGGGYGYGGKGHYGTYGGCNADSRSVENFCSIPLGSPALPCDDHGCANVDGLTNRHDPGCWCPTCQVPYSFPYEAPPKACGNPACKCGDCTGNCKCLMEGMTGEIDLGLVSGNGNGLDAYVMIPGINVHVDLYAVFKYLFIIFVLSYATIYLLKRAK